MLSIFSLCTICNHHLSLWLWPYFTVTGVSERFNSCVHLSEGSYLTMFKLGIIVKHTDTIMQINFHNRHLCRGKESAILGFGKSFLHLLICLRRFRNSEVTLFKKKLRDNSVKKNTETDHFCRSFNDLDCTSESQWQQMKLKVSWQVLIQLSSEFVGLFYKMLRVALAVS